MKTLLCLLLPLTLTGCLETFGPISTALTYDTGFGTVGVYKTGKGVVLTGDFGKRVKVQK